MGEHTERLRTPEAKAKASETRKRNAGSRLSIVDYRQAIKAKCCECMGGGIPIAYIRACTSDPTSQTPCPLWDVRPFRAANTAD